MLRFLEDQILRLKMTDFFHTHVHTEYSILDGMSKVDKLVVAAKKDGQKAIAVTDHGKMGAVPELMKSCRKHDLKPIIGQEFYIVPDTSERDTDNAHIVLLALNDKGYRILCELSSQASLPENFYRNPRIDYNMLRDYGKRLSNIVAYTACLSGEIPSLIKNDKREEAKNKLYSYQNIFPNLFFEIMKHGVESDDEKESEFRRQENRVNHTLWIWSHKYGVPIVITNDSHYTRKRQANAHDILLAIQTGSLIEQEDRFSFNGTGYHLKTEKEMKRLFSHKSAGRVWVHPHWKAAIKSLKWIYENSEIKLPEFTDKKFYIPDAGYKDPVAKIRRICLSNLKQRVDKNKWKQYKKQLEYELSVVKQAGFANEFLIVYDYVNWAKDHGIAVGSGRGSMSGVLISYLMRITDVDPIRFNLSFERALNPARPSLPDFDMDFNDKNAVIEYIKEKYGEKNVMKIGTFNRMNPRSLLGSILKTKGYSFKDSVKYTKQLPDTFEIIGAKVSGDLGEMLSQASIEISELLEEDPEIAKLMFDFNGLVKSMGSHAGGVIISDGSKNLRHFIPGIRVREDTELVTQFDKKDIESIGFIKFDILSIKTLQLIKDTMDLIGKNVLVDFPDGNNLDDQKVFDVINSGLLTFVFQLDGQANRSVINKIGGIKNFEDIVSVSSISRPGSMQFIGQFTENRSGKKYTYPVKQLADILDTSSGVILYQEQVMQIAQRLAGFDMVQVDDIKELIKGKDRAKFNEFKPIFVKGCMKNKITKQRAEMVWSMIEDASGYLYNRSHAVSYSLITYMTAYLKAHYPLEFFTAAMNISDDNQKVKLYQESLDIGVQFVRPSVRKSDIICSIEKNKIRIGLSLIKGIGIKTATAFVTARKQHGLKGAMKILPGRVIGARMQKALRAAGAYGLKHTTATQQQQVLKFSLIDSLKPYYKKIDKHAKSKGAMIIFGGLVEEVRKIKTKFGQDMYFINITCRSKLYTCVIFPNTVRFLEQFEKGNVVLVKGVKQVKFDSIEPLKVKVIGRV